MATTTIVGEAPKQQSNQEQGSGSGDNHRNSDIIIYVLGGPGSGKGTQCSKIVEHFGFTHLSAGELLESEVKSGSETGKMIQEYKKEGKLVPSDIVVELLQQAMQRSGNKKFLLDGFPRNEENRVAAEKIGRVDDNIDTVKKRLTVYKESTLPVVDYFAKMGKVRKIDAERPIEEVFESVKTIFSELGIKNHAGEGTVNAQAV